MNHLATACTTSARLLRTLILVLGLVAPQVLLYGPSLAGSTILLPLDLLTLPYVHPPGAEPSPSPPISSYVLSDQIFVFEYWRQFHAREVCAGRWPLWAPDIFCGTSFAVFTSYSPFQLLYVLIGGPGALAWIELAKALLGGTGMYLFLRRTLEVGFWPAVVTAWCLPLTAYYLVWQGFYLTHTIPWLPWLLLATYCSVTQPLRWGPVWLAFCTAATLLTGQIDITLQMLLLSGLYALWLLGVEHFRLRLGLTRTLTAAALTALGWLLGFALAAPQLWPLLEYVPTGARMIERARGSEDRPPVGYTALGPLLLPDVDGTHQKHTHYSGSLSFPESPAAGSAGILIPLVLAPLAWCSRRRRGEYYFWLALAFFTVSWTLDVPYLVDFLRLPILNMMSHNRYVFGTSFSFLVLAALGLEALRQGEVSRRWWLFLPALLLLVLLGWWGQLARDLPEPIQNLLTSAQQVEDSSVRQRATQVAASYRRVYARGILFAALGLVLLTLAAWAPQQRWWQSTLPALLMAELLSFGWGLNPQCDPALYYPSHPLFRTLAEAPPGRMLGVDCLGANIPALHGLRDLRGYDGVDPLLVLQVLKLAESPKSDNPSYARTQWYIPQYRFTTAGQIHLPAVLDMLNLRYLVFRGTPPAHVHPRWIFPDYWIMENPNAVPRVFIPKKVVITPGGEATLQRLKEFDFVPRDVAYIDAGQSRPGPCEGSARISAETPCQVEVQATMRTAGLVVLGDTWAPGWRARLNGEPIPVLRVNHMLRGVEVPAGEHTILFSYEPASLYRGWAVSLGALVVVVVWMWCWGRRKQSQQLFAPEATAAKS